MGYMDTKASEKGLVQKGAENAGSRGHKTRQAMGGEMDDTPGQVRKAVNAKVALTATEKGPKGLDSMGGSEFRGRGNHKMGG